MKKKSIVLLLTTLITTSAVMAETYRGNITAKTMTGKDRNYSLEITYDVKADKSIIGKYNPYGAGACGGERPILGFIKDDSLEFSTDIHGLKGCGVNKFIGKRDGDSWVGQINFSGEQREIKFVKVK